jgi:hypothetical protein
MQNHSIQNTVLLTVTADGSYSYRSALKGNKVIFTIMILRLLFIYFFKYVEFVVPVTLAVARSKACLVVSAKALVCFQRGPGSRAAQSVSN